MPRPTPSFGVATKDSAPHDPARGTVGTVYPWAVPALFDGEGQPFDHAPCCLFAAERLTSAGLVSFHSSTRSAEAQA